MKIEFNIKNLTAKSPKEAGAIPGFKSGFNLDNQKLFSVLDSIDEPVYISDPNSYDILYVNRYIKKIFGEVIGKKCYKIFQGLESPCPFCTNKYIFADKSNEPYIWEFQNRTTHRWYRCIDKAIPWSDGRMVRYEVAIDVTERKRVEDELKHRLEFERLITTVSTSFINLPIDEVDKGINKALEQIGNFVKADRSYIFLLSNKGTKVDNTHEWCAEGIEPQILQSKNWLVSAYPWFANKVFNLEVIHIPYLNDLPPEAEAEKKIMKSQSIRSLLAVPMSYCGSPIGFLGFDMVRQEKAWSEESITLLKIVGEMFVNALERKWMGKNLFESEDRYRQLVELSPDAIGVEVGEKIAFINKAGATLLGAKTPADIIGKEIKQFVHPDDWNSAMGRIRKELANKQSLPAIEEKFVRLDGNVIDVELTAISVNYDGNPGMQVVIRDITERKKALEMLRKREDFLSNIFASIQDGIGILDKDMNILRVNPTMEKWYSHAMPVVGKKCYEAYHGRSSACGVCPSIKTLKSGETAYEIVPKIGPGGKIRGWLDLYSFPLIDAVTGKLEGVIEYVRDITKRKIAENEIKTLNKELLRSNKRLKHLVLRDMQTGLYNHRYLEEAIEAEFNRAKRYESPLSVMMIDIDYFKSINEVYGHKFGDLVLKQLARKLKMVVRQYDVVIRFGGEEFVIVSPSLGHPAALIFAHRILDSINLCSFGDKARSIKLKLSIAVATYPEDKINKGMDLIELNEQILSKAKEYGGNRVYSSIDIKANKPHLLKKSEERTNIKLLKKKLEKLTKSSHQSLIEAIFAFAKTIELKDRYTGEHVENTVHYATEIARALNLSEGEIEQLRQAAILHDLGKVVISEKILLKKSKLTPREFEKIKKHPQIGVDIIRPIQFLHSIIPLILYHHERWDGKGYPNGLKNEEIPLGARIISIADVYQALTSDRPYRKAYSENEAIKIIKDGSGTQFDPEIVKIFFQVIKAEVKSK